MLNNNDICKYYELDPNENNEGTTINTIDEVPLRKSTRHRKTLSRLILPKWIIFVPTFPQTLMGIKDH